MIPAGVLLLLLLLLLMLMLPSVIDIRGIEFYQVEPSSRPHLHGAKLATGFRVLEGFWFHINPTRTATLDCAYHSTQHTHTHTHTSDDEVYVFLRKLHR